MRLPVPTLGRGGLVAALVRTAPGTALLVAAIVFLAALVLAGAGLWFGRAADAGLPALLASVPAGQRGLEFEQYGRLGLDDAAPTAAVSAAGDAIQRSMTPTTAGILGKRIDLVDTAEYQAPDAPVAMTRFALRIQPSAEGAIRFVEGRPPTGGVTSQKTRDRTAGASGDAPGGGSEFVDTKVLEVALSSTTSRSLKMGIGDRLVLLPAASRHGAVVINVVGLFDVTDPSDPRWFSDTSLTTPFLVQVTMDLFIHHAVALLAPEAYEVIVGDFSIGEAPLRYRWRFPVEPATATFGDVERMVADLARLQAAYPYRGSSGRTSDRPGLTSGVFGLVEEYRLQRRTAGTAFALASIGPLAAGVGLLGLAAAALARRRAPVVRLLRARGARRVRILAAEMTEAAALTVVPALLGGVSASVLMLGRPDPGGVLAAAAAVGLVAAGLLVASGVATLRGAATARETDRRSMTVASPRRLVVEALVLCVAIAGIISLSYRGTSGAAVRSADGNFDPFVAGVPMLLAIAGALVLLRLFGVGAMSIGWLAGRSRGLGNVYAFRGLARGASRLDLPFVVVVIAVAAGVFSTSVATTIERAQATAAMTTVGADYRISGKGIADLPTSLDLRALEAIGPLAVVSEARGTLSSAILAVRPVTVAAMDAGTYARVVDGRPAAGRLQADLASAQAGFAGAGAAGGALPLLVPAAWADADGLVPGSQLSLVIGGKHVEAVVHAVETDLPGLDADSVIVPLDALRAVLPDWSGADAIAFLRAAPGDAPAIEAIMAPYRSQLILASAAAVERALRATPLLGTIRDGFLVALIVAAAFAAVVVGAAFTQALALRTREMALLRALGLDARGVVGVVAGELGLAIGVAAGAGVALGLAIAWLVVPGLGVERFAGTLVAPHVTVDLPGVLAAVGGPLLASLAVTIPIVLSIRAANPSVILRMGEA
jgi:putative ABC transport system permease protein